MVVFGMVVVFFYFGFLIDIGNSVFIMFVVIGVIFVVFWLVELGRMVC